MNKDKEHRYIELIKTHKDLILKVCSMYARNREDFRDLRQDILLQVWKGLDSFRGESKVSTWLYRISLNTAILNWRKSNRSPLLPTRLPVESVSVSDPQPAFGEEDFTILREAIRMLPEIDRAIILLYLEEQHYDEISQITGMSAGAIRVRVVRIKEKLKSILQQQGYNLG